VKLGSFCEVEGVVGRFELVGDQDTVNDAVRLVEAVGQDASGVGGEVAAAFLATACEDVAGALAKGEQS
jgi:hypothetical protein